MEQALQIFNFREQRVRTIIIDGEIWFVIADVCRVLEIANVGNAISRLDQDGIRQADVIDSIGRRQQTAVANEPNLYRLIFRSDKPQVKAFQDWVYQEVLPSIRKTGSYAVAPPIHTISDALRERALLNIGRIPDRYFAMIGEAFKALYNLEAILNRNLDNLAEIEKSLGQCFSPYARDVLHIPDSERRAYHHVCVDGKIRNAWAYPIEYLPAFEKWLWLVYIPEKFPDYAKNRARRIGAPIPQISAPKKRTSSGDQLQLF